MTIYRPHLRSGEVIAAGGALVLLGLMLLAPWYGLRGARLLSARSAQLSTSVTGWQAYGHLRWLVAVTVAGALALAVTQATRRSPAIPVALSVIDTVLGAVTTIWLAYRVLISAPGPDLARRPAAYLGLVSLLALTAGAFRSLREEDKPDPARNAAIPTITLGQ